MKTAELTGAALDWAVAQCEKFPAKDYCPQDKYYRDSDDKWFCPSEDWGQGGPIIEREGISVCYDVELCNMDGHEYWATQYPVGSGEGVSFGPTPLIAAMRCYVASTLGDEVDVPAEMS